MDPISWLGVAAAAFSSLLLLFSPIYDSSTGETLIAAAGLLTARFDGERTA